MVKKYKNGWCFRFSCKDSFGTLYKPFKSGFKTKKEAIEAELLARTNEIENIIADIRKKRGANIVNIAIEKTNRIPSNIAFEDYFEFYIKNCKEKQQSPVTTDEKIKHYNKIKETLPEFVKLPLCKITETQIQPIVNACSTPCVAHDRCKVLNTVFEDAIFRRILRENPMKFVNRIPYKAKKKEHLGLDFAKLLLKTLKFENNKLYTPVLLALTGGITREEAPAILENDFEYNNHTIKIDKALVKTKEYGYITKDQKTINRERTYYGSFSIFNELHWFKRTNKIESDYLCCNINGTQMKIKTLDTEFSKFMKAHNFPECTFHRLRTILSDGQRTLGYDIFTSANTLGHGNPKVTAKYYRTEDPDITREATKSIFNEII